MVTTAVIIRIKNENYYSISNILQQYYYYIILYKE